MTANSKVNVNVRIAWTLFPSLWRLCQIQDKEPHFNKTICSRTSLAYFQVDQEALWGRYNRCYKIIVFDGNMPDHVV